ncbi:MAG: YaaA family protein [Desulfobulbaceae bacterium]|nr:YaaA family protein [Desulfobulbaceae bacterium]
MIILSPSKGQDFSPIDRVLPWTLPEFPEQTQQLIATLRQYDLEALASLLEISPTLAKRTHDQLKVFALPHTPTNAKQALLAFSGEVFRSMAATAFTPADLLYAQDQVRILSGLYGCLRPLDLIQPHRLEMDSKLPPTQEKNLSAFWSKLLTEHLNQAVRKETQPVVINLASNEYTRVINRDRMQALWLDIQFKEEKGDRLRTVAIFAKRARGMMARFLLRHRIENSAEMQQFTGEGYKFSPEVSSGTCWVFTRPMA